MRTIANKSETIDARIDAIKTDIKNYLKSIKRLKSFVEQSRKADRAPHAPRVIKYTRIPRSEKCFHWTLQNISTQVKFLEIELATLIKYYQ